MNCKRILRMVDHFKVALSIQPYFTGGVCKVTRYNQFCIAIETDSVAVSQATFFLSAFSRSKVGGRLFLCYIIRSPVCPVEYRCSDHHKNRSSSPEIKQGFFESP